MNGLLSRGQSLLAVARIGISRWFWLGYLCIETGKPAQETETFYSAPKTYQKKLRKSKTTTNILQLYKYITLYYNYKTTELFNKKK